MSTAIIGSSRRVRSQVGIGVFGGVLAWLCCISAIVLAFLGASTAAAFFASLQANYHWELVAVAFVCMDVAIYYFLKQQNGSCDLRVVKKEFGAVAFIILIALLSYFLLQAILPVLAKQAGMM